MTTRQPLPELSEREKQLLKLAAQGYTDTAIAHHLKISEATVNTYWGRIRSKRGPRSRTELVARVIREESQATLEALKIEHEHLLEQTQAKSSQTSDSITSFVRYCPEACLVVSSDRVICGANELAEQLFGYAPSELKGRSLQDLIPEKLRKAHNEHVKEYYKHPEKKHMGDHLATLALHKNGSEFHIAARLNYVPSDPPVVLCTVREVLN